MDDNQTIGRSADQIEATLQAVEKTAEAVEKSADRIEAMVPIIVRALGRLAILTKGGHPWLTRSSRSMTSVRQSPRAS
jgi:hypothetical protein